MSTPHPANRSFSIAHALYCGDTQAALDNLRLAQQMEPNAADITFLMAEIYLQDGNYREALRTFDKAIGIDAGFAPAYLGKVRTNLAQNPKADISRDLNTAIEIAPDYGEAYLQRALFRLSKKDIEGAQVDLQNAAELMPESPLVYLYRAQIELEQGEVEAALEDAAQTSLTKPFCSPTVCWPRRRLPTANWKRPVRRWTFT
jgi:tetratricopeptide (TPR) repeat protein